MHRFDNDGEGSECNSDANIHKTKNHDHLISNLEGFGTIQSQKLNQDITQSNTNHIIFRSIWCINWRKSRFQLFHRSIQSR